MSLLREQLVRKALAALSEIADAGGKAPLPKSLTLRFLLMYTYAASGADVKTKWIWDEFWKVVTGASDETRTMAPYLRSTAAASALNGICREVGYPPDEQFLVHLKRQRDTLQD